jgi:hypothetical protein
MDRISLDFKWTEIGIVCTHPELGVVASIRREKVGWRVYAAVPCQRGALCFSNLKAAEYYALALAYEMAESRQPKVAS